MRVWPAKDDWRRKMMPVWSWLPSCATSPQLLHFTESGMLGDPMANRTTHKVRWSHASQRGQQARSS